MDGRGLSKLENNGTLPKKEPVDFFFFFFWPRHAACGILVP